MVITIISPLRFKKEMLREYVRLSLQGHIVLLPVDLKDNPDITESEEVFADTLMLLHKEKIDAADKLLVMNVGGYMGRGTYEEIGYATVKGKDIVYYEPTQQNQAISNFEILSINETFDEKTVEIVKEETIIYEGINFKGDK